MTILDKNREMVVGGKTYNLCLPVKYVFRAERELVNKNLITTMANMPLCIEDTYTLFKYALIGGGTQAEAVEEIFYQALDELTLPGIYQIILETLQKSGVFGKASKKA